MKKILYISLLAIITLFSACDDKETEDISRLTEYAVISPEGGDVVYVEKGSVYAPAATASGGEDVRIQNDVDEDVVGIYYVSFIATNADGFDASTIQTVVVYEEDDILAGVYNGTRVGASGGLVLIYPNGDGTYTCSDLLSGYYEFGKGYGPDYAAASSVMTISGTTITATSGLSAFGPVSLSDGVKTGDVLTWKATLDDYAFGFNVELTKIVLN